MKEVTAQDIKKELIKDGILKKDNRGFVKIDYLNISTTTLVLDAASTSMRSTLRPSLISRQLAQTPQGKADTPSSQLRHRAKILAMVVLPTPRVPVNK